MFAESFEGFYIYMYVVGLIFLVYSQGFLLYGQMPQALSRLTKFRLRRHSEEVGRIRNVRVPHWYSSATEVVNMRRRRRNFRRTS